MITLELTQQEYKSAYQAIKDSSILSYDKEQYFRTLNIVLLKMIKSAYPDFCKNIGPW